MHIFECIIYPPIYYTLTPCRAPTPAARRTFDPEEADFFYVPQYSSCYPFPIMGARPSPCAHDGAHVLPCARAPRPWPLMGACLRSLPGVGPWVAACTRAQPRGLCTMLCGAGPQLGQARAESPLLTLPPSTIALSSPLTPP